MMNSHLKLHIRAVVLRNSYSVKFSLLLKETIIPTISKQYYSFEKRIYSNEKAVKLYHTDSCEKEKEQMGKK